MKVYLQDLSKLNGGLIYDINGIAIQHNNAIIQVSYSIQYKGYVVRFRPPFNTYSKRYL